MGRYSFSRAYRKVYKKYERKKPKKGFLKGREYTRAVINRSAVAHKIYSVKTLAWATKVKARHYRVDEICPYQVNPFFWKKEDGAVIDQNIHTRRVYVRGGIWKLSVTNTSENDAGMDMYLAFCHDGANYQSLEGEVSEAWHPRLSGQRFNDACRLSKWRKSFVLEKKKTRRFEFKIGNFEITVAEWLLKKNGWPFLYVVYNGADPDMVVEIKYCLAREITFVEGEDSRYAVSRDEMNKLQRSLEMLKQQTGVDIAGPADTTMDTSAEPST
jgi:hypothetical protein